MGSRKTTSLGQDKDPSGITEILKMKHSNVSNRRSDNSVTHRLHQGEYVFQILLNKVGIQKNEGNENEETMPSKHLLWATKLTRFVIKDDVKVLTQRSF